MKTPLLFVIALFISVSLSAQDTKKAATTSAVRLFQDKDDLTSVITIIPTGSVVEIIKGDENYLLVNFDGTQGYIANGTITYELGTEAATEEQMPAETTVQKSQMPASRYDRLMMKYGAPYGKLFYDHKIWKGLSAENVTDSWGKPLKVNRTYNDNDVMEEWIYSRKWLLFRNDILINWGVVK